VAFDAPAVSASRVSPSACRRHWFGGFGVQDKVNIADKFASFNEQWVPKIVGTLNGQCVKVAKIEGEFVWHAHEEEDELFWVVQGRLEIQLRDRTVELDVGELFIVPRGVEHRPVAKQETHIVLFEPIGTRNTGSVDDNRSIDPKRIDHI